MCTYCQKIAQFFQYDGSYISNNIEYASLGTPNFQSMINAVATTRLVAKRRYMRVYSKKKIIFKINFNFHDSCAHNN